MNSTHYAIVIGLASYPRLGDPPPSDLFGPHNDADAVTAWLVDPDGGGLPPGNVKVIRSAAPPLAEPTREQLEAAFIWLDELAAQNDPRVVGDRIYLYISGHGFSPSYRSGCLLAANAAERQFSANIWPSAWLDWLRDADYFREYILWMDCCMDRQVLTPPNLPPLSPIGGQGSGASFIAFAAPRPLKAVEKEIPAGSGMWHGVFTWNLLQGLRGAAKTEFGVVTARSLTSWLTQSHLPWLDETDRKNPSVAKEPAIIAADDGLVFGQPPDAVFDVVLKVKDATAPVTIRLWSGLPATAGASIKVVPTGTSISLAPGLFVAEATECATARIRHGFSVTRSAMIELSDTGRPVDGGSAGKRFNLALDPGDASATIRLYDAHYDLVTSQSPRLKSPPLPFGLYVFRILVGRQIVEKVILLDGDWPPAVAAAPADIVPTLPRITSAAPLPDTRSTHEYQQLQAGAQGIDLDVGRGAELKIVARAIRSDPTEPTSRMPWEGVTVHDQTDEVVVDLAEHGRLIRDGDPIATCNVSIAPGVYELRYAGPSGLPVARSLLVPSGGWRLEAYLLIRSDGGMPATASQMRRIGEPWGTGDDLELQKALVALADERPILSDKLFDSLISRQDPFSTLVAGQLLMLAQTKEAVDRLNDLVVHLRALNGPSHPDVEALSLRCSNVAIRTTASITIPPVFERSWDILLEESQNHPALIAPTLWNKVHATATAPPFLVWSTDPTVQREFRHALALNALAPASRPLANEGPKHSLFPDMEQIFRRSFDPTSSFVQSWIGASPLSGLPQFESARRRTDEIDRRSRLLGLPPNIVGALAEEFPLSVPEPIEAATDQGPAEQEY